MVVDLLGILTVLGAAAGFAIALLLPVILDAASGGGDIYMGFGCQCDEEPCRCFHDEPEAT